MDPGILAELIVDPEAWKALATWPKFSVTSYHMLRRIRALGLKPATIIDVGGNVGQFSVAARKIFPTAKLHVFEPHPECFAKLTAAMAFAPDTVLHQVAVGETTGEVTLNLNSHAHSSSILPLARAHKEAFPEAREVATATVKLSTLDALLAGIDLPAPIFLKVDTQGYEAQVLRGATRILAACEWVMAEVSFDSLYEGEMTFAGISALMAERNFRFDRPVGWLTAGRQGVIMQMDALYRRAA